jgi:hypothetical protein
MAGRGKINEVEPIKNERLYVLRNGRWQNMFVPINPDRAFSGISLAESFADSVSKYYNADIGLIPCADGGTTLEQWAKDGLLYTNALYQAKLAMRTSEIAGVLWHQGESDCSDGKYQIYKEKCLEIFKALKSDLGLSDVPFLVGGLGSFLENFEGIGKNYLLINSALKEMSEEKDYISYVSADGLSSNPDNLHFNSKSLREFGIRYFDEFKKVNKVIKNNNEKFDANLTSMELL